jgi:hypothetical protein
MSYPAIIEAISKDMQRRHALADHPSVGDTAAISAAIIAHQKLMPDYLQIAMQVLTWMFDVWGFVLTGSRFQNMDAANQAVQVDSWKKSRFGFRRDFVRFYESMFLLIALQEVPE